MFLRPGAEEPSASSRRVRELLGLDPAGREFTVVPAAVAENDKEVAILTRSIFQIMIDFASFMDVPDKDVADGRVFRDDRSEEPDRLFPALLHVREGESIPEDAFVSIRYRNRWFWIDDRDRQSKAMLTFLMISFSLTQQSTTQPAPVVTIQAR